MDAYGDSRPPSPTGGRPVDHVSTYALPESPDMPGPTYAIVISHVSERDAAVPR